MNPRMLPVAPILQDLFHYPEDSAWNLLSLQVTLLSLTLVVIAYLLQTYSKNSVLPDYFWQPHETALKLTAVGFGAGLVGALIMLTYYHLEARPRFLYTLSVFLFAGQLIVTSVGFSISIHGSLKHESTKG